MIIPTHRHPITGLYRMEKKERTMASDADLEGMGLPPAEDVRRIWREAEMRGAIIAAAGWDAGNPKTPMPLLDELAQRLIDARPAIQPLILVRHTRDATVTDTIWDPQDAYGRGYRDGISASPDIRPEGETK